MKGRLAFVLTIVAAFGLTSVASAVPTSPVKGPSAPTLTLVKKHKKPHKRRHKHKRHHHKTVTSKIVTPKAPKL